VGKLLSDKDGSTSIEYALIASIISIIIVAALILLGDNNTGMFAYIQTHVVPALSGN
jgi:pilus assembly protein Flp/PilA